MINDEEIATFVKWFLDEDEEVEQIMGGTKQQIQKEIHQAAQDYFGQNIISDEVFDKIIEKIKPEGFRHLL